MTHRIKRIRKKEPLRLHVALYHFYFYFYLFSHSQNLIQCEQKLLIKLIIN